MKTILLAALVALLVSGCCSVPPAGVAKKEYPLPPLPLAEFFKAPVDGIYSVPKFAASPMEWENSLIVVRGGVIGLSRLTDGRVSETRAEYKSVLPADEIFSQMGAGSTEQEVEGQLGKPTGEGFDYYMFIRMRSDAAKRAHYSWFTVSAAGEFVFMRGTVYYDKTKDGGWVAESLTWDRSGWRKLAGELASQLKK